MADEDSGIERLRKGLYSRDESKRPRPHSRRGLREGYFDVEEKWPHKEETRMPKQKRKRPLLPVILTASVIFFVISVALSFYLFFGGTTAISSKNVDINITGPVSISGGEELTLRIAVVNRNTIAMESAVLIIEYPAGTRSSSDINIELPRMRESLGTIRPGAQVNNTVSATFFGEESEVKNVAITVEYRIEGSNAIFFKEEEYKVLISSSPLSLTVDSLTEVISGQEIAFTVNVVSNSTNIIKDVLLEAEYPFGFELASASPEPSSSDNVWVLGDIPPGESQQVILRGVIEGQNEEERIMRFRAGIQSEQNRQEISTVFGKADIPVVIKRPFITVNLALNGNTSPEYITTRGERIRADVSWQNNLPTQISDAEISVSLSGAVLDKSSVSASRGFYNSVDNTITWSRETEPALGTINPGSSGRVSFSFSSADLATPLSFRNPQIFLDVDVKGRRLSEQQVPEEIRSTLSRIVKVTTDLLLSSRSVYTVGPFSNSGPIPPKAEVETTYTIIWTVTNSANAVSDAKVVATLPSYVRWLDVVSPSSEDISFNPVGGMITWNIGNIPSGSISSNTAREVAFQVALTPSLGQVGLSPVLVNEQIVSGVDSFTNTTVGSTRSALTTRLSTDPNLDSRHAFVTN